jgi:hypothetical protein
VVSFTPLPLYSRGKEHWYPLDGRLGGPQSRSGRRGEEKLLDPTGTRTPARGQSLTDSDSRPVHVEIIRLLCDTKVYYRVTETLPLDITFSPTSIHSTSSPISLTSLFIVVSPSLRFSHWTPARISRHFLLLLLKHESITRQR